MAAPERSFHETGLTSTPIREIGLRIAGSRLEPIWAEFESELQRAGIRRLRPRPYLSTEWGVPFNTIAIAIPFYLAWPNLTALHADRMGYVEGVGRADILRYLRHEMGHVVNYGYRLYEQKDWIDLFGPITRPYTEEYRAVPFSPRYVHHLPGWYAQKHPDEDWAETFAVWMTPALDWRSQYAGRPAALRKLNYCDAVMKTLMDREPVVSAADDLDEDVGQLGYSLDHYYQEVAREKLGPLPQLDAYLREVFESAAWFDETSPADPSQKASALIRRLERHLMAEVYRWTGHFPGRTRALVRYFAERADELGLSYQPNGETRAVVGATALVTTLATNYMQHGRYVPDADLGRL
jgi:hypothetical protein